MISCLNIKNIALIGELTLNLKPGLNILSGETGAGKSIIIDSINFVLGDKADRSLIRYGETTARVEVVFENIVNFEEIKAMLSDYGIDCEDDTVIVTRTMTNERSDCRINGRVVNLSFLRALVANLVDIHSQNEHQSLMKPSNHILLLDAFCDKSEDLKKEFRELMAKYRKIQERIDGFASEEERERAKDVLSYKINEIDRVNWTDKNEETELVNARNRFNNSQKIAEGLDGAAQSLGDDFSGALNGLKNSMRCLRPIAKYDEAYEKLYNRLDSLAIEADDVYEELKDNLENLGLDIDIESVEKRLDAIRLLKKKYGSDPEEIREYYDKCVSEYELLADAEAQLDKLNKEKTTTEKQIVSVAEKLHKERTRTAEKFSEAIRKNLSELGMKNSRFEVKIDYAESVAEMNANGGDSVEFLLSPNPGEPLKPLIKIASGGEASRFMLALKNIIAEVDKIGTLIFDEIDTGISGVIAKVVACKLYDIAKSRQVIAITHLPQLASMGDVNYLIEKRVSDNKTNTYIKELKGDEIYKEIMRLTGAVENSEIGLSGAKELKTWANNYKLK